MAKARTKSAAVVLRTERRLAVGAAEDRHAARVERFGEADAVTLSQMDAINDRIRAMAMPANTKRAMLSAAASWVRFCDSSGIGYATVDQSSLRTFGSWLVTHGREVKKGEQPRGYAEATARNRASLALKWMRDVDRITLSADDVKAPGEGISAALTLQKRDHKHERGRGQAAEITWPDVVAMVRAVPAAGTRNLRTRAIVLLSYAIAARTQEVADLAVRSIDRSRPDRYAVEVAQGKTGSSERTVYLDRDTTAPDLCPLAALDAWLDELARFGRAGATDPLFPGIHRHGTPADRFPTAQAIRDAIKQAGEAAELRDVASGHGLRAGLATDGYRAGVPDRDIRATGGWVDDGGAMARYNRASRSNVLTAVRDWYRQQS